MPLVIVTSADGATTKLEVAVGTRLMRAIMESGIDGIVGDCGGNLACATCHVFIDPAFLPLLPGKSDTENSMLDFTAAERMSNSRLSCQVKMTEALGNICITL
jgi:2Fe-2S ferredoxin